MSYDLGQVTQAFDTLASKVTAELDAQFSKGRIKGTDYANVYSNLMNTIIQTIIDVPVKDNQIELGNKQLEVLAKDIALKDKDITLKDNQIDLGKKQLEVLDKDMLLKDKDISLKEVQLELHKEDLKLKENQLKLQDKDLDLKAKQIRAFDNKVRTDLFKAQIDSWAMMFSSGMLDRKPDIIANDEVTRLYNDIKNSLR